MSRCTNNTRLDERTRFFKFGFDVLATQLRERYFTSVSDFSHALSVAISKPLIGLDESAEDGNADIEAISSHLNEVKPGTAQHMALTQEQKDIKRLAKRILKAVKEPLEDATRKEAELKGLELEEEIRKLDAMRIFASKSLEDGEEIGAKANGKRRSASDASAAAGASDEEMQDADAEADERADEAVIHLSLAGKEDDVPIVPNNHTAKKSTPASETAGSRASSRHSSRLNGKTSPEKRSAATEPLSPPISTSPSTAGPGNAASDPSDVFANGGVPWYLEPFDPVGTTVHTERYTGRDVLRDMSEELSDIDDDTLTELAVNGSLMGDTPKGTPVKKVNGVLGNGRGVDKKRPKKKGRRQQWTKPRVR